MNCTEYGDRVAAHADDQMPDRELAAATAHVAGCSGCAALLDQQRQVSERLRRLVAQPPSETTQRRIRNAATSAATPSTRRSRTALVGSIAAGFLVALYFLFQPGKTTVITTLSADIEAAEASTMPIALETADPQRLRNYYSGKGMAFTNTVEDLEPAGLRLVGGGTSSIEGATTTRTIYQSQDNQQVVCRRYLADEVTWPEGGQRVGASEVFSHRGVNISLTRIGDVVCAMASRMPSDRFVHTLHAAHR